MELAVEEPVVEEPIELTHKMVKICATLMLTTQEVYMLEQPNCT